MNSKTCFTTSRWFALALSALLVVANMGTACAQVNTVEDLIAGISSDTPDTRIAAWKAAAPFGAKAVGPLAVSLGSDNPETFIAAKHALDQIVAFAGRPGAEAEKNVVAAELAKLLAPTFSTKVRREAVHRLALIGGDTEASAIGAMLTDAELAQDAGQALNRLPGEASVRVLADALRASKDPTLEIHIVGALSHKKQTAASEQALVNRARADDSEIAWQCLEALARSGMQPSTVFRIKPDASPAKRLRFTNAILKAADVHAAEGNKAAAAELYASVATEGALPAQVCAALTGLADVRSESVVGRALGRLLMPGTHEVAMKVLSESDISKLESLLLDAIKVTDDPSKAVILQILGARKSPALPKQLEMMRDEKNPLIQFVVAELSGTKLDNNTLWAVATSPLPWFSRPATEQVLAEADKLGQSVEAISTFTGILNSEFESQYKVAALKGIEKAATGSSGLSIDTTPIQHCLEDSVLAPHASKALIAIITGQGDQEKVKQELLTLAETAEVPAAASLAVDKLREMGVNTAAIPQRKGYITDWKVLGPFPNADGAAANKSFFPEEQAGQGDVTYEGATFSWKPATTDQVPASVDLHTIFTPNENVAAYAYAEITVGKDMPVAFHVGSDDSKEIWVNGAKLITSGDGFGFRNEPEHVDGMLKAGVNKILLKVLQRGGWWRFYVRATQPDGASLDLSPKL